MKKKYTHEKDYRGFSQMLEIMKPMTFKQKVEHLWTYYKEWLLVIFFGILFIGLMFTIIEEQKKEVLVGGMMINISIEQSAMNYMTTEYAMDLGAKNQYQVAEVDYTNFGDPLDPENGENSYYASMILPSRVTGGMLDYIILDQYAMEYYIAYDVYMDLREFFTEEEIKQFEKEGRIIYARQEDEEDAWAVAVKITDIPFVKENIKAEGDVYFALSGSSKRKDMCRNAWERIMTWKPAEE